MSKVTSKLRALTYRKAILTNRLLIQANALLMMHNGGQPYCIWAFSYLNERVDLLVIAGLLVMG